MEVEEFVTSILQQLETSLAKASAESKEKRFIFDKSISFDLAVTHSTNKEGAVGGGIKAGIKIVDFDIGGKGMMQAGQQMVQRIQFSVDVWDKNEETIVPSVGGRAPYSIDPHERY